MHISCYCNADRIFLNRLKIFVYQILLLLMIIYVYVGGDNFLTVVCIQQKGFTPLHIAAKYGNVPISKILLSKGASPNAEGKNGLTPLHVATHYNSVEVAQLLMEHKANPHAAAKVGHHHHNESFFSKLPQLHFSSSGP